MATEGKQMEREGATTLLDRGVWPGADEAEDDEAPFFISEVMIYLITNSY